MTDPNTETLPPWVAVHAPVKLDWVKVGGTPKQTMLTGDGYKVWVGEGVPTVVIGAAVGDLYIDSDSGMLYRLD